MIDNLKLIKIQVLISLRETQYEKKGFRKGAKLES